MNAPRTPAAPPRPWLTLMLVPTLMLVLALKIGPVEARADDRPAGATSTATSTLTATATAPSTSNSPSANATSALEQGLTAADRRTLFHMAEGSELVPLAWARAARSARTGRPFLERPERFGFIADVENLDQLGLPIGMTAAPARGAEAVGPMIGVNCAACHTGLLTYKDRPPLRVLGAPATFDLNAFYGELFKSLGAVLVDDDARRGFLEALAEDRAPGAAATAALTQQLLIGAAALGKLGAADRARASEQLQANILKAVAAALEAVEARARAAGHAPDPADVQKAVMGAVAGAVEFDVLGLLALALDDAPPIEAVLAAAGRQDALGESVRLLLVQASLLHARIRLFGDLAALHEHQRPTPGPGRIDAFDGIRDLVFPRADALAANSPVDFPALWTINQTYWLHWDGNTNSLIERNVGQALGQGAAFEKLPQTTYHSSIRPENLYELEMVVRKLQPPVWPAERFGAIDPGRARRGEALYRKHCVSCHAIAPRDGRSIFEAMRRAQQWAALPPAQRGPMPTVPPPLEKIVPLDKAGTDPARALNFATNIGRAGPQLVGGTDFARALSRVAWGYTSRAYEDSHLPPSTTVGYDWPREMVQWRTTRGYVARPLVSAWATAPYLHNGSVPTLYHLLLPPGDRPKLFPVGQREFDPENVGLAVALEDIPKGQYPALSEMNTTMSGNSNAGHEHGTELSDAERFDLIEYIKGL